jgi:hypothetical protein
VNAGIRPARRVALRRWFSIHLPATTPASPITLSAASWLAHPGRRRGPWDGEQLAGARDVLDTLAAREQAVVADAVEAARQHTLKARG